jgi:hypothetical protein
MYLAQILPLIEWHTMDNLAPTVRVREARFPDHIEDIIADFNGGDRAVTETLEELMCAG